MKFLWKMEDGSDGREWFQILAILIGSLSSLTTGLFVSWTSPFIPQIVEDKIKYDVTQEQASYLAVFNIIGTIVLTPFLAPIINKIGRKNGLLISSIPYIACWLMKAFVTNIWGLYFARLLIGCGDAFTVICVPIYIAEISTPKVRGLWGNAFICSVFCGQFLINLLGAYFDVKQTSLICISIPVLLLIIFPFMPESPYYYLVKNNEEDARNSLRVFRRRSDVEEELQAIKAAVKRQMSESSTWTELMKSPVNRKALVVASFLRCSQLFGGLMTFAAYTKFIFINSGANVDPGLASILYSACSATCHSSASFALNKLKKRNSFIISTFLCGIILFLLAVYFLIHLHHPGTLSDKFSWFPLTGMMTYLLCSSFGLGTVPALMLGELFSSSVKGKGVAIVGSLFGVAAFAVNNIFYYFSTVTGLCGPFFLFSACNFSACAISYYIVPETKDKTLEEIQQTLSGNQVKSPKGDNVDISKRELN